MIYDATNTLSVTFSIDAIRGGFGFLALFSKTGKKSVN